jgi:hypothetical protein
VLEHDELIAGQAEEHDDHDQQDDSRRQRFG